MNRGLKRFWTTAEAVSEGTGFSIRLDGKPVRTPAKALLNVPSHPLALSIAAEWQGQGDRIDPRSMPMTRSANSAIDKVSPARAEVAAIISAYGACDLLCYRAAFPASLVAAQAAWDAPLDWAASRFGARLRIATGVMPIEQDADALSRLSKTVTDLSPFELTALHDLVALSGSLVLGLAVADGAIPVQRAWDLSRIDEAFQNSQWGEDAEAKAVSDLRRTDFFHAKAFLDKVRT